MKHVLGLGHLTSKSACFNSAGFTCACFKISSRIFSRTLPPRAMASRMWTPRYFDIGVNFSDSMFHGLYNGSTTPKHPSDIEQVVSRALLFNVRKILVTASSIQESKSHFLLLDQLFAEKDTITFGSTVGVHPCAVASEFYGSVDSDTPLEKLNDKLNELKEITQDGCKKGYVKAFGEIGLDYDRLHYSTKKQQCEMFKRQLQIYATISDLKLPLFLHMRAACDDFVDIIAPFIEDGSIERGNGVVHSFTGNEEELRKILDLGFYVGVNGCSLKTEQNLNVAKQIPMERLMIETDAPWCEIRPSHAAYGLISLYPNLYYPQVEMFSNPSEAVQEKQEEKKPEEKKPKSKNLPSKLHPLLPLPCIKKEHYEKHRLSQNGPALLGETALPLIKSRNEPVFVGHVAEIMTKLYGIEDTKEIQDFVDLVYDNSCKVFRL